MHCAVGGALLTRIGIRQLSVIFQANVSQYLVSVSLRVYQGDVRYGQPRCVIKDGNVFVSGQHFRPFIVRVHCVRGIIMRRIFLKRVVRAMDASLVIHLTNFDVSGYSANRLHLAQFFMVRFTNAFIRGHASDRLIDVGFVNSHSTTCLIRIVNDFLRTNYVPLPGMYLDAWRVHFNGARGVPINPAATPPFVFLINGINLVVQPPRPIAGNVICRSISFVIFGTGQLSMPFHAFRFEVVMNRINRFCPITQDVAGVYIVRYPSRVHVVPNEAYYACSAAVLLGVKVFLYVIVNGSIFTIKDFGLTIFYGPKGRLPFSFRSNYQAGVLANVVAIRRRMGCFFIFERKFVLELVRIPGRVLNDIVLIGARALYR